MLQTFQKLILLRKFQCYTFSSNLSQISLLRMFISLGSDLLVHDMESKSISSSLDLGDHVSNLLDAINLFSKELSLKIVTEVCVSLVITTLCKSSRLWLTVFSSSKAASIAWMGVPHSMLLGLAMSWNTTLPPLLDWYAISFIPCSRSSPELFSKNLANPWRAWSSRLKNEAMER